MSRSTESNPPPAAFVKPTDPAEVKRIESANAVRQFDLGVAMIQAALAATKAGKPFRLRPSEVFRLNACAVDGMEANPGVARGCPVWIAGSLHTPPPSVDVLQYVEEFCDYVNDNWSLSPVHLAAYLLWRVNWVHPFTDGNGRTSRMIAYVVLCVRAGALLPGFPTIPEQIAADRSPYYQALDSADAAFLKTQTVDVTEMESLVTTMLTVQLSSVLSGNP